MKAQIIAEYKDTINNGILEDGTKCFTCNTIEELYNKLKELYNEQFYKENKDKLTHIHVDFVIETQAKTYSPRGSITVPFKDNVHVVINL